MNHLYTLKGLMAIAIILLCSFCAPIQASHIPGANITYTCNPANPLEYTFTLTVFRRCPGTHPTTMPASYFTLTNDCGLVNPTIPVFNQVGTEIDVNQLCNSATSNCSGGTQPGIWKYTYEATIILPANCNGWHLEYSLCCRDASSNLNGGSGNTMVTTTTLNTSYSPCNNSPVVTAPPIPYACTNTNFNYCLTTYDQEGDSMSFSLVAPLNLGQAPITHQAGFSITQPLNNFTLDPQTGCLSLNHPNVGNYVVAILIREWDSNGNILTEIIHDFQIMVINCTNTPPNNPVGGISNFSGTGTQTGPNTIAACFGDQVCFDVVFADVDATDVLTITTDGTTLLPGATFTQTGINPVTGTFCWTSQPGYLNDVITFTVQDDGCPVLGTSGFAVDFDITTGVYAGPDVTICGTQTTQLQAFGATSYTWSPAAGLSCTNCPNPIASPSSTTTYTVTGNLVGVCTNVSTVTVNVVPDFPLTLTPSSATICANELVQLNASGPAARGPFTYNWTPASSLNDPAIGNPIANPIVTTNYTVDVTSANGCVMTGNIPITVSGVGPTVNISPVDTTICPGTSAQLNSTAVIYPLTCGISSGCTGTTTQPIVGTGTSGTTTYSPFYGSTSTTSNYTKRIQYIYTAAELNAMGYYGGTIRELALFVTTSTSYNYDDVEIWMGCTSQDEFTNTNFASTASMTQVFGPTNNINLANNNWHNFNITDWDWDGTSNLIIQFCSRETGANGSESVRYSSTSPAYRCIQYATTSTTINACTNATGSRYTSRADMRFTMCQQAATAPVYSWSPVASLSDPTIANPIATPTDTTTYLLNVTDGVSGCTGSAIATINVLDLQLAMNPTGPINMCAGDPAVNLNAQLYENGAVVPLGAAQAYTEATSATLPMCSNVTGGDHTVTFNSGVPDASGNVTLTLCVVGDFGSSSESFTVYGEGGVNLGTYNEVTAGVAYNDCGTTPLCNTITITQAQWNLWNVDGQVIFTIDVNNNVNNFCSVGGGTSNSSCITSADVAYTGVIGTSYIWSPTLGLSNANIQNPTVAPSTTTTYTVTSVFGSCTLTETVDVIVGTPSTTPTLSPIVGTQCPNTTMTLNAGGGVAGVGSAIHWYTGPNGTGTWLGTGSVYSFVPTNGQTIYIRREGACNITTDDFQTINLKDYVYGVNAISTTNYCTDDNGWHHFYDNDEILLSIQGDLTGAPAGFPEITIWDNGTWYQQSQGPFTAPSCAASNLTPGEEYFEMERSWNVNFGGGTLNPPYNVRFYYEASERAAVENAAANWMATYPACGYSYKYANPLGAYWFKNVGSNYTAPDYDGLHLTGVGGVTPNGINYGQFNGVNSFSGGTLGITLVPNILLPVQWLYFDGETDGKVNHLRWATEAEQNSERFNVQRSKDGVTFETIGSVAAQGNSTTTTYYTFDDEHPFEGANYYRLELLETSGEANLSNTILLVIAPDNLGYSFYPNPTDKLVYYQYEATKKEALRIEVLDVLGKQVSTKNVSSVVGMNRIPVDLSAYPNGTYMVRVHHEGTAQVHTSKIIKNKE